jgi:nicotinamidase-related amidase
MTISPSKKTGLDAMLTPDNCALMLIDHQPFQAAAVKNIDVALMINNAVALSKAAKAFDVPTLLTTVIKDRGGNIFKQIQDVFPEQVSLRATLCRRLPRPYPATERDARQSGGSRSLSHVESSISGFPRRHPLADGRWRDRDDVQDLSRHAQGGVSGCRADRPENPFRYRRRHARAQWQDHRALGRGEPFLADATARRHRA